jgi:hypothetical protein
MCVVYKKYQPVEGEKKELKAIYKNGENTKFFRPLK